MLKAFRGSVLHSVADPGSAQPRHSAEFLEDGLLVVEGERILAVGAAADISSAYPNADVENLAGRLILPGFIDAHVHFPQIDIIGAYGEKLLEWLEHYAYPSEMRYVDADYARAAAGFFLDELLANGTTTAAVFATVHAHAADALFEAAEVRQMRLIAGKVLMDRDCPSELSDTPESGFADSRALIERWHGRGRLGYAITPRFALTSSPEQLAAAGRLAAEFPDVWIQTHLAETEAEIAAVAAAYPDCDSYLDVYDRHGLLRERAVFGHCLHMDAADIRRLAEAGGAAAFCPTSNLFLGSGLFDFAAMTAAGVPVALATDVGAGTCLSMLRTMAAAYEVQQLRGYSLHPFEALYLATLGAAEALGIADRTGSFVPGKDADFIVIDPAATRLSERRIRQSETPGERLFALIMLGDDRHIVDAYVAGQRVRHG